MGTTRQVCKDAVYNIDKLMYNEKRGYGVNIWIGVKEKKEGRKKRRDNLLVINSAQAHQPLGLNALRIHIGMQTKRNPRRHLRPQEHRLLKPILAPLAQVRRQVRRLDARRRLAMEMMTAAARRPGRLGPGLRCPCRSHTSSSSSARRRRSCSYRAGHSTNAECARCCGCLEEWVYAA